MIRLPSKEINGILYWLHYCPKCKSEMPYTKKCNCYRSIKFGKCCRSCSNPMKKSEVSAKFKGELNPAKRLEFRKWMSENNPMFNDEVKKKHKIVCNLKERRELIKKRMIVNNPCKNKEVVEKRTDTYTKRLSEGLYTIKNNWKTGYYVKIDGNKEWYDSSYELKKMKEYDFNRLIWTKKHKIRIPYINEYGLKSYYVPDFLISNTTIEEIKGWVKPTDVLKAIKAIEYCKNHKMSYHFYLGEELTLQPEFSYEHIS